MIRPRTRWRESLSFGVIFFFFPQSPLDPPAVCIQSAQPVRSTAKVMLGCHGHWSSLWLTGHFSSTNLICIWDCHTSTLVSNLPQHTRHSLCWLDTVHRRSPCFLNDWACKSGISVLPPPLPALGDRYLKVFLGAKSLMCCTVKKQSGMSWPTPAQGCYRCCLPSLMHYSFFIFSLI